MATHNNNGDGAARSEQPTPILRPRALVPQRPLSSNSDAAPNSASLSSSSHPTSAPNEPFAPFEHLNLSKLAPNVVPSRSGSVLSRGLILKSDYRFLAQSTALEPHITPDPSSSTFSDQTKTENGWTGLHLSGASNLRDGGLGVWGVAQPTRTGVRSLLSLLRCKQATAGGARNDNGKEVAWFVTREEPILYIGALTGLFPSSFYPHLHR